MNSTSPPRILIVDDSYSIRTAVRNLLSPLQAEITEAENGLQGLDMACSQHFDLIVTDVEMPIMDGFALCKALKKTQLTSDVPVVILSGMESDRSIEAGFKVGAAAYVRKTNCRESLLPRVKKILGSSSILRGKRAMIVDDSRFIRKVLSAGLVQVGFQVSTAENGHEALALMDDMVPDLILSDIHMPVMDGQEFFRAVQGDSRLEETPFVVMSGSSDRRVLLEMMGQGASAYLMKPFDVDELVLMAEKLLSDQWKVMANERQTLIRERGLLLSTIASLVGALEARDSYTRSHSENVAHLSYRLAERMQLPREDVERIELAARLHDVGKIGIRDNVLLKDGQLSEKEHAIIREHPLKGVDILKPISSMSKVLDGVLYHHERMDGSGYPSQLRGNEIPLDARIIAVADVYDALNSDRPYRKSLGKRKALAMIREMSGHHLCPYCVGVFEKMMDEEQPGNRSGFIDPDHKISHWGVSSFRRTQSKSETLTRWKTKAKSDLASRRQQHSREEMFSVPRAS